MSKRRRDAGSRQSAAVRCRIGAPRRVNRSESSAAIRRRTVTPTRSSNRFSGSTDTSAAPRIISAVSSHVIICAEHQDRDRKPATTVLELTRGWLAVPACELSPLRAGYSANANVGHRLLPRKCANPHGIPVAMLWYAQFTWSTRSARNDSVVVRGRGRSPARTVVHFDQYLANKGRPGGAAAGNLARRRRHLDDARCAAVGTEFRIGAWRTGPGDQVVSCRFGASRGESRTRGGPRGRTNHDRLRNPTNAPRPWAAPLVKANAGRRAEDVDGFAVDLGDKVGVIRPIAERALCAGCHGRPDQFSTAVRAELKDRYPSDRATGFGEGDIRGWYWVEVPKQRPR